MAIGQVFMFLVAALTFALIMIFGYKAINDFMASGENVAFVQFKTDLETSVKKIYSEYGAVRVKEYFPPMKYTQICFVDLDAEPESGELEELCAENQAACIAWESAQEEREINGETIKGYNTIDENVFLTPSGDVKLKVHRLSVMELDEDGEEIGTKGYLCEDIKAGKFSLVLEGKGDRTMLSNVPKVANE